MDSIKYTLYCFLRGFKHGFAWPSSIGVILSSKSISNNAVKCVGLNGIIFLGSLYLFEALIKPYLIYFLRLQSLYLPAIAVEEDISVTTNSESPAGSAADAILPSLSFDVSSDEFLGKLMDFILTSVYYFAYIWPIYCLSFILNSLWYQEIADAAFRIQIGKPVHNRMSGSFVTEISSKIADEVYRILLQSVLVLRVIGLCAIPRIGPFLSFLYMSCLYAYYCFEYKWINKGWSLEYRLEFFERRWAYFAGFGTPFAFCTFFFPQFISAGFFAVLFPSYIIMANNAVPIPPRNQRIDLIPVKIAVFDSAKSWSNWMMRKIVPASMTARLPPGQQGSGGKRNS
eukprot:Nk52_evm53s1360 gene=Nk52_evmTU53s1360